jgi:2-keto-4-pentenoate hydratase/2-oxohepta-3-ene-1,7-dioic acid hydratase in catechol pathway
LEITVKNCPRFLMPMGSFAICPALRVTQNGSTATMVFGVAHLVSYLSRFMSLQAGDIISTGTPPGVGLGQKPPVYLRPGNVIRLGVEGLGEQRQTVVPSSFH